MANTYTQIHLHAVFAVQNRLSLIHNDWQEELYKYITGVITNNGHKLLQIGGMPDHIHILFGMRPAQTLSNLMQNIKGDSSKWINEKRFVKGKFSWQEGYGAFSYGKSQINDVVQYIQNQEKHHAKRDFQNEFLELLQLFGIEHDERYILKDPE
ncbi:MAG: IS200/IS605 family transposase [Dysgonamonadaceae bacterium]|jgi:REP element-mobilizing transposase RayT|nr:IS200/IS605 family transposase [Dysgonamonadaceae bacterium]